MLDAKDFLPSDQGTVSARAINVEIGLYQVALAPSDKSEDKKS